MNDVLDSIGDAAYTISVIGAILFVVLYSLLARPWRTLDGLHILAFMSVLALILGHGAITAYWPHHPGHLAVRAVLYVAMAAVIVWRILILIRVQVYKNKSRSGQEILPRESQ